MAQINKPNEYFNTKLYIGNSTDNHAITGVNFQPDLVWIKRRNQAANHNLFDSVRGATKTIKSNLTNAEATVADTLKSFDADGFTLGDDATVGEVNPITYTMASWNWLAGGTGVSNTVGDITSTVSANTTSGFSIVSYTGTGANATVGHGLGSAPAFIIFKDRSTTKDWFVYHQSISPATGGKLNLTVNPGADPSYFNNTAPTSSVFSIGDANTTNPSGNNMIAYCFAEKKGFSKFGSYTGNGSADGTFVYTGFKPAWFMVKKSSASGDSWVIIDNTRFPYNYVDKFIYADEADAESGSAERLDFLSNGIKIRATHTFINTSGATYIYMAFAENPLVGTNNIPATAR